VLKLKPRLWQNSLRRIPLLTNLAPTAELPHGYVAWALTTLFLRSSVHFNTDPACRTGVLVRLLPLNTEKHLPVLRVYCQIVLTHAQSCSIIISFEP